MQFKTGLLGCSEIEMGEKKKENFFEVFVIQYKRVLKLHLSEDNFKTLKGLKLFPLLPFQINK